VVQRDSDGKKDLKLTLIHFICAQAAQRRARARHGDVMVEASERMQAILAFGCEICTIPLNLDCGVRREMRL
jgi:hypothetical protein